jgi:signaling intermediate in Toll pathway protein
MIYRVNIIFFSYGVGVIPDDAMGYQILAIFGERSHVMRRYQRMMYWMPKFKHENPYPVPRELPNEAVELAKLALARMNQDLEIKISIFQVSTDIIQFAFTSSGVVRGPTGRHCRTSFLEGRFSKRPKSEEKYSYSGCRYI